MSYKRQPVGDVLYDQRWSVRRAALKIGVDPIHLRNAVFGRCRPNERVRRMLPVLLDTPLEKLFLPEQIDREYGARLNRNGTYSVIREDVSV